MEVIDLSHKIEKDMTTYTDDTKPIIDDVAEIGVDGYNEKAIKIFSHTGTHVDAPHHMIIDGKSLDRYDINKFVGDAVLIDVSNTNTKKIELASIKKYEEEIKRCDFLIIRTGWDKYWKTDTYFNDYKTLTVEAAKWITKLNLKGIGIDTISIDSSDSSAFEIHKILLSNDIIIIENLTNLQLIKSNTFKFIATPIKYEKSDGSPVRAIAIL